MTLLPSWHTLVVRTWRKTVIDTKRLQALSAIEEST
jgi:hypothetical protein